MTYCTNTNYDIVYFNTTRKPHHLTGLANKTTFPQCQIGKTGSFILLLFMF